MYNEIKEVIIMFAKILVSIFIIITMVVIPVKPIQCQASIDNYQFLNENYNPLVDEYIGSEFPRIIRSYLSSIFVANGDLDIKLGAQASNYIKVDTGFIRDKTVKIYPLYGDEKIIGSIICKTKIGDKRFKFIPRLGSQLNDKLGSATYRLSYFRDNVLAYPAEEGLYTEKGYKKELFYKDPGAPIESDFLDIRIVKQEGPTCWAAAAASVINYNKKNDVDYTPIDIYDVLEVFPGGRGTPATIIDVCKYFGVPDMVELGHGMSFDEVKYALQNESPPILLINAAINPGVIHSVTCHTLVLKSYDYFGGSEIYYTVMDPNLDFFKVIKGNIDTNRTIYINDCYGEVLFYWTNTVF